MLAQSMMIPCAAFRPVIRHKHHGRRVRRKVVHLTAAKKQKERE